MNETFAFAFLFKPDQILATITSQAKFLLAAKLYELGRLSSGEAAQLAGKSRVEFLFGLAQIGIPMSNLRAEEAATEIGFALHE